MAFGEVVACARTSTASHRQESFPISFAFILNPLRHNLGNGKGNCKGLLARPLILSGGGTAVYRMHLQ